MSEDNPGSPLLGFDVTKLLGSLAVPQVDVGSLLDTNRRNMDALMAAQRSVTDGYIALARRQAEIFQNTVQVAQSAIKARQEMPAGDAPAAGDIAKMAVNLAIANMKELAEMAAKSNADAVRIINERVQATLSELKTLRGSSED